MLVLVESLHPDPCLLKPALSGEQLVELSISNLGFDTVSAILKLAHL